MNSGYDRWEAGENGDDSTANDTIASWWSRCGEPTVEQLLAAERRTASFFDHIDCRILGNQPPVSASAGTIFDTSALLSAPQSTFVQTVIQFSISDGRPMVIPAAVSATAVLAGHRLKDTDVPGFTFAPIDRLAISGIETLIGLGITLSNLDVAQVVYTAQSTGFTVLTARPELYMLRGADIETEHI